MKITWEERDEQAINILLLFVGIILLISVMVFDLTLLIIFLIVGVLLFKAKAIAEHDVIIKHFKDLKKLPNKKLSRNVK